MLHEFLKYIRENRLASRKDRILLAVSGGIDSMVMADLFVEAGFTPGIAHCNFTLRGNDADLDEELVRHFASDHGLRFHSVRFDTKGYASANRLSIQMAARELRYNWFGDLRHEYNYRVTAIAHNKNDNVETILINLVRGTGITGLTGIKPSGNGIIRPLLFATREDIEAYSKEKGVPFREDSSNAETKYTRNKLRHLVIPVLKEINPSVEESIASTASRLEGTLEIFVNYIESIRKSSSRTRGDEVIFDIRSLQSLPLTDSLAFELFRQYGINATTAGNLVKVINGRTGGQVITHSSRLVRNRGELIVTPLELGGPGEYLVENAEGFSGLPFIASAALSDNYQDLDLKGDKSVAFLDFEKLTFPVTVRKWRKGDAFFPFGMKHPRKLSDYFIDRKFSLPQKEKMMLMESGGKIVWIIGERIDDRFRVTPATSVVLRLESKEWPGPGIII
jgi:tRNA(Ile)-lysidine synthase